MYTQPSATVDKLVLLMPVTEKNAMAVRTEKPMRIAVICTKMPKIPTFFLPILPPITVVKCLSTTEEKTGIRFTC